MAAAQELSAVINVRMDPRTRYLLELASRKQELGNSEIVRQALNIYFSTISLYEVEELEEPFPTHERPTLEQMQTRRTEAEAKLASRSLADLAHLLWSEDPETRLKRLAGAFPRLVTKEERNQLK